MSSTSESSRRAPKPRGRGSTTARILVRAQAGDRAALDALVRRHEAELTRLAHGRVPSRARGMYETGDLVQATYVRVISNLPRIRPGRQGAFFAYLRTVLRNLLYDLGRRVSRQPEHEPFVDDLVSPQASPFEVVALHEQLEAYERALQTLSPERRDAVRMRLELCKEYEEIAAAIGAPSANAARMQVVRALAQLAETMTETRR